MTAQDLQIMRCIPCPSSSSYCNIILTIDNITIITCNLDTFKEFKLIEVKSKWYLGRRLHNVYYISRDAFLGTT